MAGDGSCYDLDNAGTNKCMCDYADCTANPCQNGATCNGGASGGCICQPGFTGALCEINIDDCNPQPCKNFGQCKDGINSFTCECAPGYSGDLCEIDIDECTPNPCRNGKCTDHINDYSCVCDAGYTGKTCESDIDDYSPDPCNGNGECKDLGADSYQCTCNQGFRGDNCENEECQNCDGGEDCSDKMKNLGVGICSVSNVDCQTKCENFANSGNRGPLKSYSCEPNGTANGQEKCKCVFSSNCSEKRRKRFAPKKHPVPLGTPQ